MHNQWSREGFAAALAEIQQVTGTSVAGLALMAGVSRSQASRWSHGKHQPAYASMRQLALAVRGDGHRDLADRLMESAGYAALPEGESDSGAALIPRDPWELAVLSDPDLPEPVRRRLIGDYRAVRSAYQPARRERRARRESALYRPSGTAG